MTLKQKVRYGLVNDEYYTRQQMKASISTLRPLYECIAEAEDMQGLEQCIRHKPDLIIAETHLSDGDTLPYLLSNRCTIPIVFIASDWQLQSAAKMLNLVEYILKPVSERQFKSLLEKFEAEGNHFRDNKLNNTNITN